MVPVEGPRDLQSLTGKQGSVAGKDLLRRMFRLLKGTARRYRFIQPNAAFRFDLA